MGLRRHAWPAAALAAATLGLVFVAAPVAGQTPVDESLSKRDARRLDNMEKVVDELRAIVFKGRDSGKPVEVESADTGARIDDLTSRVHDLEQSLTRVNGSLETTAHELDLARKANANLRDEVKTLSDELADLQKKESAPAPGAASADVGAEAQAAPAEGDPNQAFAKARQLMLSGEYDAAEAAFSSYVQTYPDAPKTPEARYWWGKTLSVKGAHAQAATAYIGAIRGWPQTAWAPDAVVELSRELVALKKTTDACQALAELPRHYAKASASVKARAAKVKTEAKCG
jgi:tol-pal system protein YbgF